MIRYSIQQLSELSGITKRTLRYYDEIGLLKPNRDPDNDYRYYGQQQIDLLQHILFYRAMGVKLSEIQAILLSPDFERQAALEQHLSGLEQQKSRLDCLIQTVRKTIADLKGEIKMENKDKFEGFKQQLIDQNEQKYGDELRKKYGEDAIDASHRKVSGMTQQQWDETQQLSEQIAKLLQRAIQTDNPAGELAQQACDLHRQWICRFWKDGQYSKQAHLGLAQMYVADERFKAYYEQIAPGAAEFLRDALLVYCK